MPVTSKIERKNTDVHKLTGNTFSVSIGSTGASSTAFSSTDIARELLRFFTSLALRDFSGDFGFFSFSFSSSSALCRSSSSFIAFSVPARTNGLRPGEWSLLLPPELLRPTKRDDVDFMFATFLTPCFFFSMNTARSTGSHGKITVASTDIEQRPKNTTNKISQDYCRK